MTAETVLSFIFIISLCILPPLPPPPCSSITPEVTLNLCKGVELKIKQNKLCFKRCCNILLLYSHEWQRSGGTTPGCTVVQEVVWCWCWLWCNLWWALGRVGREEMAGAITDH